jgi:small subunit ribosomal protein S17
MAEEETNEEAANGGSEEVPETPAIEGEAEEYAEAEADTAETEAQVAEAEADAEVAEAPAARPEPEAVLSPKERRRRRRAARAPAPRGPLTPQERQAERDTRRSASAHARRLQRVKDRAARPRRADGAASAQAAERAAGTPKARQGIVISDKAAKTITVRVDTSRRHRRYKKIVRSSKTLHAHDEHNEAHEGDLVRVVETRPLSATKRWRLVEVLERAR